jgi:hypothetical protein
MAVVFAAGCFFAARRAAGAGGAATIFPALADVAATIFAALADGAATVFAAGAAGLAVRRATAAFRIARVAVRARVTTGCAISIVALAAVPAPRTATDATPCAAAVAVFTSESSPPAAVPNTDPSVSAAETNVPLSLLPSSGLAMFAPYASLGGILPLEALQLTIATSSSPLISAQTDTVRPVCAPLAPPSQVMISEDSELMAAFRVVRASQRRWWRQINGHPGSSQTPPVRLYR